MKEKYTVYDQQMNIIGQADNFRECKELHHKCLPADLENAYAGLDCSRNWLKVGMALPVFYEEYLTPELYAKYWPDPEAPTHEARG